MANEIMECLRLKEGEIRREAAQIAARRLKAVSPVDTGALKRSIRPIASGVVLMNDYGVYINRRGVHKGWIQRALR